MAGLLGREWVPARGANDSDQTRSFDDREFLKALSEKVPAVKSKPRAVKNKSGSTKVTVKEGPPSLKPITEKLDQVKKPKCRTVQHYLCDRCDGVITNFEKGFVIQGNVYAADPDVICGIIGNAFPNPDAEGKIEAAAVRRTVLCTDCLLVSLGLGSKPSVKNMNWRDVNKSEPHRKEVEKKMQQIVDDIDADVDDFMSMLNE